MMKIPATVQTILNKIEVNFPHFVGKSRYIHERLYNQQAVSSNLLEHAKQYKVIEHSCWPYFQYSHNLSPPYNHGDYLIISPYVYELASYLGAVSIALNTWYDEGGYVSWHHNADVPGRNMLFCWSETGDGVFKLHNELEDKTTELNDVPGWSVKSTVFHSHASIEKYPYCWHAMATNCKRYSLAFRILDNEMSKTTLEEFQYQ